MEEEKKSKFNIKIIIIGLVLFIIGGAGVFAFTVFFTNKEETPEAKKPVKVASSGILVKVPDITVNLADPGGKRYLKTEIHLEVKDEKAKPLLETRLPIARDRIVMVLSSKTQTDLEVYNRDNLRQELMNQINEALSPTVEIQNLYFAAFVTQ
ncbi:MAG: flagellar basal body protein FliL [Firmicutes bacterium]|nr:flagellar basal body protein FliL [Bacillota bacterium]